MPEKMNITQELMKNSNSLVSNALIAVTADLFNDPTHDCEWMFDKEIDVCLTLNGIEVPFVEFLERFNKEADRWVETEAHRLLETKLWKITEKADEFNKALLEEADKLLPNRRKEEDYY